MQNFHCNTYAKSQRRKATLKSEVILAQATKSRHRLSLAVAFGREMPTVSSCGGVICMCVGASNSFMHCQRSTRSLVALQLLPKIITPTYHLLFRLLLFLLLFNIIAVALFC